MVLSVAIGGTVGPVGKAWAAAAVDDVREFGPRKPPFMSAARAVVIGDPLGFFAETRYVISALRTAGFHLKRALV
jgi:hypothetical protein